ncbi:MULTISPECIES: TetR/AcrR family transcriptional regulator [Xanthomonas]|uniref:TetR/AcrR family transcriptional regulator n=1 Tax=Xanthomonas TaxID=338 RepID=UPI000E1F4F56|nr:MULTISPECIES: TetR/AcrR family transcriptional regulator [Xanthomonas]
MASDTPPRARSLSGKRGAILAAARALSQQDGFDRTSMDSIARHALVSKATVYAYFASKEVLFRTTLEALAHAPRSHWDVLLQARGPLDQRLIAVANALLNVASRSAPDDAAYGLVRPPLVPSQMREEMWMLCFERYDRMMRTLLAREVDKAALAIDNLPDASVHFFGLMTGLPANAAAREAASHDRALQQAAYVSGAVALFLRAYRPVAEYPAVEHKRETPSGF